MFKKSLAAVLAIPLTLVCLHAGAQQQAPVPATSSSIAQSPDSSTQSSNGSSYTLTVPPRISEKNLFPIRPFSALAIGIKADTLGAGFELATPLSQGFNLRAGITIFAFNDPFSIDGIDYDSRLHLKSGQASLDWFPWHNAFHISPGILYAKNTLAAPSSVAPGRYFELGSQGFTNSIDDPLTGTASVTFPRQVSPMLTVGFGNLIPRSGRHLSVPFEIGVAYTGAAQIKVTLNGTACTSDGCFTFSDSPEAQAYLQQEILKLNNDLKKVPIYPIVSIGLGYRF
jgi:hypothetical protein